MQRPTTSTYPDVLGMLSGGARLNTDVVQSALGIYPRSAIVGQPFEALVLLQNTCDQTVPVSAAIRLPRRDASGNRLSLFTPQDTINAALQPGEVGLLHIPIVPQLPTLPTTQLPINVSIETRRPRNAKMIRSVDGGRVAGVLPMSPYRRRLLYEVGFAASSQAPNTLTGSFDVLAGHILRQTGDLSSRYESLWSAKSLSEDQEKYAVIEARTRQASQSLTRTTIYEPLREETERRFNRTEFRLRRGEAIAIAKLMTYVMEDGLELEDGFRLTDGRWFQLLAAHIDEPKLLADPASLISVLYNGILYDSMRLGYHMLARSVHESLGTPAEHSALAARMVNALEGRQPLELSDIYLPLVLAGLMLHTQVKSNQEDLWATLEQIRIDWRARLRSSLEQSPTVTKLMDHFIQTTEQFLVRARIPRPG